jgi:hypothetical protein
MRADARLSSGPGGERSRLRSVALPSEHGGWGLTLEPAVLGLLVAPSAVEQMLLGTGVVVATALGVNLLR